MPTANRLDKINLDMLNNTNKSKQDEAYEAIKQMIVLNKITPGTMLVERQLCEALNLSRTPIRGALRELENENLVTFFPGRGMVVSSIRIEDVIEIYEIREVLDVLAIKLFLLKNNQDKIDELRSHLQAMKKSLDAKDFQDFINQDMEFHNCYLNNTGNLRLESIMISLHDQINRFLSLTSNDEERCLISYQDHKKVMDAIDEGDNDMAEQMVYQHIQNAREYHVNRLTKR